MTWSKFAATSGAGRFSAGVLAFVCAAAIHFWPAMAPAQTPGTGFATAYKGNANKPVDIQADSLEVDDRQKTAVFRGNVSATQGDVNLRSREIYVTYTSGGAKVASADGGAASPFGGGGGEITKLDAKGDVLVTMKPKDPGQQAQQTKSDWAIYDVKKQQVTLGGDVVLSQGDNVMRGSKLVIDLTTGVSRFENDRKVGGTGQIRLLFTPKEKDKEKAKEGAQ